MYIYNLCDLCNYIYIYICVIYICRMYIYDLCNLCNFKKEAFFRLNLYTNQTKWNGWYNLSKHKF